MSPADWLEASTTVASSEADLAEALLLEAGALSVTLQDAADAPVLEPAPGEMPLWPRLQITGLFEGGRDPLRLLATLHGRPPVAQWRIARLEDRAWEREWLRDFRPLCFGTRLAVVPTGMTAPAGRTVVRLDPGLAFGTGTHPTTGLCLEWLDGLAAPQREGPSEPRDQATPLEGALVIDYGCGSGILAIAALQLGAAEAIAVDLDPQALLATRANATLNGVADKLHACAPQDLAELLAGRRARVLVANILAGPLQQLLPCFADLLADHGRIALSGILVGQESVLEAAAQEAFQLEPAAVREDWVRLSGRRKTSS
ncbi:50S ribosomal protein L11 methyltransferase [Wenzhouxiangella sp. XN24]|uniref:50S ribosomal protein L11 methyltransferase n=1 Tax=Wenzhouxiangella sp. XN24 TaxID=2713569 RepID=UPI0013EB8DB4|nr:50S ribosomal protein L11 methyltransferase [Wenzhouxiangella sp. XN24]NGX15144.1 50S ribosomal protein L11 methyltransferase [Wenzhouxiangella sp. XN24]